MGEHPLIACLALEYGLTVERADYVGAGMEGRVWRVRVADGSALCAKWFHRLPPGEVARRAALKRRLEEAGLPVPRLRHTIDGTPVATLRGRALEVCDWVDGEVLTTMSPDAGRVAGMVLARLHLAFRVAGEGAGSDTKSPWQSAERATDDTRAILDRIDSLPGRSDLDREIHAALTRRLTLLDRVDALGGLLPALDRQLVHGDHCPANLLFEKGRLAGIIDLMVPLGSPLWELSRIAFEPQTVVKRSDWVEVAAATVGGYRSIDEPPGMGDLVKVAALYHLTSSWGIDERYGDAGKVFHTGAEDYFLNRQATARVLLESPPADHADRRHPSDGTLLHYPRRAAHQ